MLESSTLACDSVRIGYKVNWDSEAGYDWTVLQYFDDAGQSWVDLPVNGGVGRYEDTGSLDGESFAFATTNGTTRIRFRFTSDGGWSDEDGLWPTDGAIVLDGITVDCYSGAVLQSTDFEDFESVLPGANSAGIWTASTATPYGDFAELYPGVSVLQNLTPCGPNSSFLWGFFDDPAVNNYGCAGFPEQGVIPYGNADGLYIQNEIWSPKIPVTGGGNEFLLDYSVYHDGPFSSLGGTSLVLPTWQVRSWVGDSPGQWKGQGFIFFIDQRGWYMTQIPIARFIDPGATHIQVALGVQDICPAYCWFYGQPVCHSHAPLYDDVRVMRVDTPGPQFVVRHYELFQDNFAEDGTLTGTARADVAMDILSPSSPGIRPGDSLTVTVFDPALAADAFTGVGPAVYAYVAVWPENQPGKSGAEMEAPKSRSIGKRFPHVGSLVNDGVTWYCFRMDSVFTTAGTAVEDRYCFDLNDTLFNPGDTICYFFKATNIGNESSYFSRELDGQGENFVTGNIEEAFDSPMEFTILPAGGWRRGGDILYVDVSDDRGGPAQLFFDSAFDILGIRDQVDRYDVLSPSSVEGNTPASRVKDVQAQIMDCYQKIVWSSGSFLFGTIGDGTGNPNKSDDFGLLMTFLDQRADNPGVYISGDDVVEQWITSSGSAVSLRSTYMNFNLDNGDHIAAGEPASPRLTAVHPAFIHSGVPDEMIALGGCPLIRDFDLLTPTGLAASAFVNQTTGKNYIISQATPNNAGSTARVILSGFSFENIRDVTPGFPPTRAEHMRDILEWFQNEIPDPTGVDPTPQLVDYLDNNYPNPFNPTTTIRYGIKEKGHVLLKVYNAAGQLVKTLVNGVQTPNAEGFTVRWNGESNSGVLVASGVYFYRLVTEEFAQTKKMVLLK
jgi:hypothetical protein